jgi:hypothetical protein
MDRLVDDEVPGPGARLAGRAAAAQLRLTNAQIAELEDAVSPDAARGSRYPAGGIELLDR